MKRIRHLAVALSVGLTVVAASGARAATFGPNLDTAVADNAYGCGSVYLSACTVIDPLHTDMEMVLPDPVKYGNQTGVVTAIHVKYPSAAPPTPVQFVVVEWSGRPGEGQPFPSGVMAVSDRVTLRPGMNHFNTNLPVDFRLAPNGFESWSQISLTMLDGSAPIPGQSGGPYATTGLILDSYQPLTSVVADLTTVPHTPQISGFYPMTLLMAGDVTITTKAAETTPVADDDDTGDEDQGTDDTGDDGTTDDEQVTQMNLVQCVVPNLKGLRLAAARRSLARAHCGAGKVTRPKSRKGRKRGLVVKSTNPRPGTILAEDARVAITLRRA